ncbi:MAG TPA: ParB/RepB/Spo0J family partition protein [Pyrinomonadaceae bacterium]|nr:ParB/RepB/Spo0J family partition protein [Pyrinomonadaceae bacterium]
MTKKPLGRGLSALLPRESAISEEVRNVEIDLIRPSDDQPRTRFDQDRLNDLALSIKSNGIIQPLLVRRRGGMYELIAGERRWRAAQLAEIKSLPVIIREIPDERVLELSLIENIQRQELNPIEEAKAYRKLIGELNLQHDEVARRVGRDRSVITNYLRILKLPDDIQALVAQEKLSMGHARALLGVDSPHLMRSLSQRILQKHWSVRETENRVRKLNRKEAPSLTPQAGDRTDPNIRAAEAKLRTRLGRQVKIVQDKAKSSGRLELHYYDSADLDNLFRLLIRLVGTS